MAATASSLVSYPRTLDTARLTLRDLRPDDEDAFLAIWADPDVWRALRPGTPFDPGHGARRFQHHRQHWKQHGFGLWLICDRDTGDGAGWVGPTHPDYVPKLTDEIEIAWSLRRPFWGRGIATEAAQAAVSEALAHLHPAGLISLIARENGRSAAVAKRLGMRDLGSVAHGELEVQLRLYSLEASKPEAPK
jgi:RimJ/RimL family protein N-acetyltransferase